MNHIVNLSPAQNKFHLHKIAAVAYSLHMISFSRRSVTTGLATAAMAAALVTAAPMTASADIVDDYLNQLPAGEITCAQAESVWTSEADYNSKARQARAAAIFHPRGGEINQALNRIDQAANRCGLKGGGTASQPAPNQPAQNQQTPNRPAANQPARNQPAPSGQVISIPVAPGTPTVNVPVGGVATIVMPDLARIVIDFLGQFGIHFPR